MSKRILGLSVLVFCVAICRPLLHSSGLWNTLTFRYFPVGMELLLPPLMYVYVLALTEENFTLRWQHGWHFAIGLFYALYDISVYLLVLPLESFEAKRSWSDAMYYNQFNKAEDYLIVFLTVAYVYLGYRRISAFIKWLKQFKNYQNFPIYKWLKSIIKWSALLGLVLLSNHLLDTFSLAMDIQYYRWRFFSLILAFLTYYLGFMGYRQDGLKVHEAQTSLANRAQKLKAGANPAIEQKLLDKLEKETVYLDPALTLKQLAADLEVPSETISIVINQKFEMSFRDLLNHYRVRHFKGLVSDCSDALPSILSLALDSGFNSQASFYRAFKKFEGLSPKTYIENNS